MMNSLYIKGTRIRCGNSNLSKSSFCFLNKLLANGCAINITSFSYIVICHSPCAGGFDGYTESPRLSRLFIKQRPAVRNINFPLDFYCVCPCDPVMYLVGLFADHRYHTCRFVNPLNWTLLDVHVCRIPLFLVTTYLYNKFPLLNCRKKKQYTYFKFVLIL